MKKLIEQIPIKLRVCLSVFIIGIITLLIFSSIVTTKIPITVVLTIISAIATAAGTLSLIIYWFVWADD